MCYQNSKERSEKSRNGCHESQMPEVCTCMAFAPSPTEVPHFELKLYVWQVIK